MRIGVLTGGGDVPGLNPCIRALVYRAVDQGHEVIGIRRGWSGLLNFNPDDPSSLEENTQPLNKQNTRTIDRTGGTILHTSRTHPGSVRLSEIPGFLRGSAVHEAAGGRYDFTPHVLWVLGYLKIDVLVPIGGDDTLSYGARLHDEAFYGEEDAFGHRKLGGIGLTTAEALKRISGVNTIYQQVAYLMRSGAPDSLDLMVAVNYAQMAMDLINAGQFGQMVALRDGVYTSVPANVVSQGLKRVDVDQLYDIEGYRPKLRSVRGKPMFLY